MHYFLGALRVKAYQQPTNATSSKKIVINSPDIKLYNSIFSKGFASKFCLKSGPWARKSALKKRQKHYFLDNLIWLSMGDWFESHFVGNAKNRFSCVEVYIITIKSFYTYMHNCLVSLDV